MPDPSRTPQEYAHRHVRFGWWSLLGFTAFGLVLELFHGFKLAAYLDVGQETRRLMWTLAHAHGTLLAVLHILFGVSARSFPIHDPQRQRFIWRCLMSATLLLPGGFFLGGIAFYSGDPGLGIILVPVGAVLLLVALYTIARSAAAGRDEPEEEAAVGRAQRKGRT